jgi:thioredoxin-dependent peroxiredoxin
LANTSHPQEGSNAPEFVLPDGDGATWRLSDHRGKVVVLLFYPGD